MQFENKINSTVDLIGSAYDNDGSEFRVVSFLNQARGSEVSLLMGFVQRLRSRISEEASSATPSPQLKTSRLADAKMNIRDDELSDPDMDDDIPMPMRGLESSPPAWNPNNPIQALQDSPPPASENVAWNGGASPLDSVISKLRNKAYKVAFASQSDDLAAAVQEPLPAKIGQLSRALPKAPRAPRKPKNTKSKPSTRKVIAKKVAAVKPAAAAKEIRGDTIHKYKSRAYKKAKKIAKDAGKSKKEASDLASLAYAHAKQEWLDMHA